MNQLKFSICLETKQNNNSVEALYDEVFGEKRKDRTVINLELEKKQKIFVL